MIFVMAKCFLCGADWSLKHYSGELRLQSVKETLPVYSENHVKLINTLCGQNTELLVVRAGGAFAFAFVCYIITTWYVLIFRFKWTNILYVQLASYPGMLIMIINNQTVSNTPVKTLWFLPQYQ
jgi:hypothetical protein